MLTGSWKGSTIQKRRTSPMYARVVTTQYQPGKIDEGLQIFLNSIMPAARQQAGYKGALALGDRTTGKAIAIGLRETAADIQATETRQQQGYKGYLSLTDRTTGKAISISLWETEADLLASETSGYLREQLGKVAHVLATQVVREVYEVSAQE
jgi:hypothetical protein